MNVRDIPDRPVSPPDPGIDELIRADQARAWRELQRAELVMQSMRGQGEFWDQAHSAHAEVAFAVVRKLITQRHLSDAMRWQALEKALRGLATEWATWRTEEP